MATKRTNESTEATTDAPAEFPITINEFCAGTKPIEGARAFLNTIRAEAESKSRLRSEWQELFALFMSKPTDIEWTIWRTTNQGGRK